MVLLQLLLRESLRPRRRRRRLRLRRRRGRSCRIRLVKEERRRRPRLLLLRPLPSPFPQPQLLHPEHLGLRPLPSRAPLQAAPGVHRLVLSEIVRQSSERASFIILILMFHLYAIKDFANSRFRQKKLASQRCSPSPAAWSKRPCARPVRARGAFGAGLEGVRRRNRPAMHLRAPAAGDSPPRPLLLPPGPPLRGTLARRSPGTRRGMAT